MPEASWSRASSSTFKSTKRLPELPLPPGSGGSDGGRQHRGSLVGILAGNQLRWPGTAPSPTGACGAGQPVLGTTGEWEQGVIAMPCPSTPPAACGCPTPSGQLFYQGALLVMGTSRTLPARACNTSCLVAPVLLPVLAPPPSAPSLSVSLPSATVKQLDHLPARIDFCFPISKLDGRKRLKTVCQFEVE